MGVLACFSLHLGLRCSSRESRKFPLDNLLQSRGKWGRIWNKITIAVPILKEWNQSQINKGAWAETNMSHLGKFAGPESVQLARYPARSPEGWDSFQGQLVQYQQLTEKTKVTFCSCWLWEPDLPPGKSRTENMRIELSFKGVGGIENTDMLWAQVFRPW